MIHPIEKWTLAWVAVGVAAAFSGSALSAETKSGPIESLERLSLNGVEQTILIRGQRATNPILLFLHGGPGATEMPYEYVNRDLERDFIVVHWDQRGTGKSYHAELPCSEMRVANFVEDTTTLTRRLLRRFGQKKLYLVCHSWGSLVGALTVARHPELFHAYVGISQFVNVAQSQRLLFDEGVANAKSKRDERALRTLKEIGPPPYPDHILERRADAIEKNLADRAAHQLTRLHFASLALLSPVYSVADDIRMIKGISFSGHCLEKEIYTADLFRKVPQMDVPVYFFEGRYDTVLSPVLLERYYRTLLAPRGKHLIWFEKSDHWLHLEEREKYRSELRECLLGNREY